MKTEPISVLVDGLDVSELVEWITAIPLTDWPKGDLTQLKPAMVTNPEWHGIKKQTDALVARLVEEARRAKTQNAFALPLAPVLGTDLEPAMPRFYDKSRWLSVVMPGHDIEPHADAAEPDWVRRVHVPLVTNEKAIMHADGVPHHLDVGKAYLFDKTCRHAVTNDGDTPRIHFMFELMRREP